MNPQTEKPKYKDIKRQGEVSMWDLLTLMSGGVALGNAYVAAKGAKLGNFCLLAALAEGLAVGVICIWIIRAAGETVLQHMGPHLEQQEELELRMQLTLYAVYFSAVAWLAVSGFLGYHITKLFIKLFLL